MEETQTNWSKWLTPGLLIFVGIIIFALILAVFLIKPSYRQIPVGYSTGPKVTKVTGTPVHVTNI